MRVCSWHVTHVDAAPVMDEGEGWREGDKREVRVKHGFILSNPLVVAWREEGREVRH